MPTGRLSSWYTVSFQVRGDTIGASTRRTQWVAGAVGAVGEAGGRSVPGRGTSSGLGGARRGQRGREGGVHRVDVHSTTAVGVREP